MRHASPGCPTSLALALCVALAAGPALAQASFSGLGAPAGDESHAFGVSADGCTVAGATGPRSDSAADALRWGAAGLDTLPPAGFSGPSGVAVALSADGAVAVGAGTGDDAATQGFPWPLVWDAGVGVALADLPESSGELTAVSADGHVVVGSLERADHSHAAFRYEAGVVQILTPAATFPDGRATGVSADGVYSVGWAEWEGVHRAFRAYGAPAVLVDLIPLLPGEASNEATAISADGSALVGTSGAHAFRIDLGNGALVDLGPGTPSDLSGDGDVVVGSDPVPWIWTPAAGRRDLATALASEWGLDLTGWTLTAASAVSDDGSVIVGTGVAPGGGVEAWKAVLGPLACPGEPPDPPPPAPLPGVTALLTRDELWAVGAFDFPDEMAVAPDGAVYLSLDIGQQIVERSETGGVSLFSSAYGNPQSLDVDRDHVLGYYGYEVARISRADGGIEALDLQAVLGGSIWPAFLAAGPGGLVYASTAGGGCYGAAVVTPHGFARRLRTAAGDVCFLPDPSLVRYHESGLVFGSADWRIRRLGFDGSLEVILDGSGGGLLEGPSALALDAAGNVYVTGFLSDNVVRVDPDGGATQILGPAGDLQGHPLAQPTSVAVDSRGHVLVTDGVEPRVFEVFPNGANRVILDETGDGSGGELYQIFMALGVDAADNVYALSPQADTPLFGIPPSTLIPDPVPDSDGDGIPDASDDCPFYPNFGQEDANGDGYGNLCDPDFDDDGIVGTPDYISLVSRWGSLLGDPGYAAVYDLDSDGTIGMAEYLALLDAFGGPPGLRSAAP